MTRPGDRLRALGALICDAHTMEHVVDPAVADLQNEGASWRGYTGLITVPGICVIGGNVLGLRRWTTEERAQILRTVLWSTVLVVACTALLELPVVTRTPPRVLLHPSPLR